MIKAWIQLIIFSSKCINTEKIDNCESLNQEIVQNALLSNILIMSINCVENHVHFLIYLNEKLSIGKTTDLLKNITLVKLREKQFIELDFRWKDEYLAITISPALVEKERLLIQQQQQLHLKSSLHDEIEMLLHEEEERYLNLSTSDIMSESN